MSLIDALAQANGQGQVKNFRDAMNMAKSQGGNGPEHAQTFAEYLNTSDMTLVMTKGGKSFKTQVTRSRMAKTVGGKETTVQCYGFKIKVRFKNAAGENETDTLEVTNGSSLWEVLDAAARKVCKFSAFDANNKNVTPAISTLLHDIMDNGWKGDELGCGVTAGQNGNNKDTVRGRLYLTGTIVEDEDEWED